MSQILTFSIYCYLKTESILKTQQGVLLVIVGLTLLYIGFTDSALAQGPGPGGGGTGTGVGTPTAVIDPPGGTIFQQATCNLLDLVLTKYFGAMITAITGMLASIGAAAGFFKGAWALVFVSVGCFIFPQFIEELFPGMCSNIPALP